MACIKFISTTAFFDALENTIARTIADLAGSAHIELTHLSEAIGFRSGMHF